MPIRPAVPGLLRHQIMWQIVDQVGVTPIWTYRDDLNIDATRVDVERAVLRAWLDEDWASVATLHAEATMIKTWSMAPSLPAKFSDDIISPPIVGDVANPAAPNSVTCAISLRTEPIGSPVRGINGRVYHVGLNPSLISANTVNDADTVLVPVYEALQQRFFDDDTAGSGYWVVMSYFQGGTRQVKIPRETPLVLPVDHIISAGRVCSQRRRLPRQSSFPPGS